MPIHTRIVIVTLLAASIATASTQASALVSAKRAEAIKLCSQRAQMAYPTIVPEGHHGRYEVYAACMTDAGQLP